MTEEPTHQGNDSAGAPTLHRGLLENCGAPDCGERAREWKDGDPLMEAIAAAVHELCERSDSGLVIDDPRNIAAAASLAAVRTLGRDRCIHSKTVHDAHHPGSPVPDCPWCTAACPVLDDTETTT